MSDRMLEIDIDTAALLAAIDRFPEAVLAKIRGLSHLTAQNIAREVRGRMHRSSLPHVHTAEGITVEESRDGQGFVVLVTHPREKNLPLMLEHGTQYMLAQPSVDVSARLEEEPHNRRIRDGIQEVIDEAGLGQ